jgi:hypothetical protein
MLTAEQLAKRREFGASDAPTIMSGDAEKLIDLWRVKIGTTPPHDFSDDWPVQWGSHGEQFILNWHERKTGHALVERGSVIYHPTLHFVSATLDAYRAFDDCVIDAKVVNAWYPLRDVVAFYTPQMLVQRDCRGATRAALLIVHGTSEPVEIEVQSDLAYTKELWTRIAAFQLCVETLTPPATLPRVVPPEEYRTIDLDFTTDDWPNWAHEMVPSLQAWSATKDAHDSNAAAADAIKKLLPDDVGRLRYSDVAITRNRRGALTIKREAA